MCEVDITEFFNNADAFEFSASVAERGRNAGPETWANAKEEAASSPLLASDDQLDAWRDMVRDMGAWDDEEIDGWDAETLNALFIQYVSRDIRELEALCMNDDGEIDWDYAEELSEQGIISGRMLRGTDGRIYYYVGCYPHSQGITTMPHDDIDLTLG